MKALRHLHVRKNEKRMKKRMQVLISFSEGNWREDLTTALVATVGKIPTDRKTILHPAFIN